MKKLVSIILALTLALSLCACAQKTAAPAAPAAGAAQPAASETGGAASEAPKAPEAEPTWRYALSAETVGAGEIKGDDGAVLATQSYELPVLITVCDGDAKEAPEEMRKVCDAFSKGVRDYTNEDVWDTLWDIGHEAKEIYQSCFEDGREFIPLADELTVQDTRQDGDLVSVRAFAYINLGGAHPDWGYFGWNFDLATGTFFKLSDLTDSPAELHRLFSHAVVRELADSELFEVLNDDFYVTVDEREDYSVFFGEDGAHVWFDEYEIAPRAAGIPEVTVSYGEFARYLNERGRRLLNLSQEDRIMGDYHEAEEMRYWFEGDNGIASFETDAVRTVHVDGENGGWDLWYYRVAAPAPQTMAALRTTLERRFTPAFADELLKAGEHPVFREFDGELYQLAAGRGGDVTVGSVDYRVELNADKTGGKVVATIHRQDYDETKMDWVPTGETEDVEFPFELTADGARFAAFPCIY